MDINIIIYTLSIIAAVNFFYIGIIANNSFHGDSGNTNVKSLSKVFMAIAFIGVWYTFSLAIIESNLITYSHNLAGVSMLFSGYIGPLLFIFTYILVHPKTTISRKSFFALLAGLPGSTYAVMYFLLPKALATSYYMSFTSGNTVDMGFLSVLFLLHSTQQALFFLCSLFISIRYMLNKDFTKSDKEPTKVFLIAILSAILTLIVSNLLPIIFNISTLSKLGPILTLPSFLIVMKSLNIYNNKIHTIDLKKKSLNKYLSPQVIDTIFSSNEEITLGGELTEASILFVDMRGFTKMSENKSPSEVVAYLNAYLEEMNNTIFNNFGMIDKFIGDAILVVFGVPSIGRNHKLDSLNCARDILASIDNFNNNHKIDDYKLKVGIGIHTGEILHGNIGSGLRMEYTVIGDVVNTASRLEKLSKKYNTPVIFSENTFLDSTFLCEDIKHLGDCQIRGKKEAIKLYSFSK